MARRRHGTFTRHFLAMQMILAMEDGNGNYPNVDYVRDHGQQPTVADLTAQGFVRDQIFPFLMDMFQLVDPDVYSCFHQALIPPAAQVGTSGHEVTVDEAMIRTTAKNHSRILERAMRLATSIPVPWDECPPPHSSLIMREVISELLV